MDTVPLSEAKSKLSEIVSAVERTHERVTVTKNGRPTVVVISVEDLASIEATLDLLSDPEAVRQVDEALREVDRGGAGVSISDLRREWEAQQQAKA